MKSGVAFALAAFTGVMLTIGALVAAIEGIEQPEALGGLLLITLIWLAVGAYFQRSDNGSPRTHGLVSEKAKRDASDAYTLIDRMVDDMTTEEREYLYHRLSERLSASDDKPEDAATSLAALLAQRTREQP